MFEQKDDAKQRKKNGALTYGKKVEFIFFCDPNDSVDRSNLLNDEKN